MRAASREFSTKNRIISPKNHEKTRNFLIFLCLSNAPKMPENRIGFYAESLIRRTIFDGTTESAGPVGHPGPQAQANPAEPADRTLMPGYGQRPRPVRPETLPHDVRLPAFTKPSSAPAISKALLDTAALAIQARLRQANVAVFILEKQGFDIHLVSVPRTSRPLGREHFQQWFYDGRATMLPGRPGYASAERLLTLGMEPPGLLKQSPSRPSRWSL